MGRMYRVPFSRVAVSAAQDLFEIKAGVGKTCFIHGWIVSQSSEVGDAQEEGLNLELIRANSAATSGSGGSALTPVPQDPNDTAAGFVAEINNTTMLSAAGMQLEEAQDWNVRNTPYPFWYTPELRPQINPLESKVLRLKTTPADQLTMSGVMFVEEQG